jgi:hypothetical protein
VFSAAQSSRCSTYVDPPAVVQVHDDGGIALHRDGAVIRLSPAELHRLVDLVSSAPPRRPRRMKYGPLRSVEGVSDELQAT